MLSIIHTSIKDRKTIHYMKIMDNERNLRVEGMEDEEKLSYYLSLYIRFCYFI